MVWDKFNTNWRLSEEENKSEEERNNKALFSAIRPKPISEDKMTYDGEDFFIEILDEIESDLADKTPTKGENTNEKYPICKIDFKKMTIEKYQVSDNICYTVHPEDDLLEEIYKRLCDAVSFQSVSQMERENNFVLSIQENSEKNKTNPIVDFKAISRIDERCISVPLTDAERANAVEAISDFKKAEKGKSEAVKALKTDIEKD